MPPRWATSASTFPDTDERWHGADSLELLRETMLLLGHRRVRHVDATVVLEAPKLGARKAEMAERLAAALGGLRPPRST